jgi:hypothetical protein
MSRFIKTYNDESPTIGALREVLVSMRWNDIEVFANEVEQFRRGMTEGKCARALKADMIIGWAKDGL